MAHKQSVVMVLLLSTTLTGCNPIKDILDMIKGAPPAERNRIKKKIPNGVYRADSYKCNGVAVKIDHIEKVGTPTQVIENGITSLFYTYPNCVLKLQYNVEDDGDGHFDMKPSGLVACSNSQACNQYAQEYFYTTCGDPNGLHNYAFRYQEKPDSPGSYIVTVSEESKVCSLTHAGVEPLSHDLNKIDPSQVPSLGAGGAAPAPTPPPVGQPAAGAPPAVKTPGK